MFDFVHSLQEDGFTVLNYAMRLSASLLIDTTEKSHRIQVAENIEIVPVPAIFNPRYPNPFKVPEFLMVLEHIKLQWSLKDARLGKDQVTS